MRQPSDEDFTVSRDSAPSSKSSRIPAHDAESLADQHRDLLDALGVELNDEILGLSLTHRSYAYENGGLPHNERLEFLGDTVLGLAVTEFLYLTYPDRSEGELAKIRASVVNMYSLAEVARGLGSDGLGVHLFLGKGEEMTGGRDKHSILADAMESILGAVYLQHGLDIAKATVVRLFDSLLASAPFKGAALDWKTSLQEKAAELSRPAPNYSVTSDGPDHAKAFIATVAVGGEVLGDGEGKTKKEAEQKAAARAWKALEGESKTPHPRAEN